MRLKNSHIFLLSLISLVSFGGLIYYQYVILDSQKKVTERQLENNITALNLGLRQISSTVEKIKSKITIESTYEWKFKSLDAIQPTNPVYEFIYQFDSLYNVYGLRNEYQLSGLITKSRYCQVEGMDMGRGVPDGKSSFINEELNTMCLCHVSFPFTFDIGYTVDHQEAQLLSYQEPTILSMLLLTVLFFTCILTLYVLQRQKKISELRESFVNTLSHNFETPIFSINLAVKSLLKLGITSANKQADKYLELIASENMRLKNYSEKMLHEALIGTEKLELDLAPTDIGDILQQVVDSLSIIAEQNNLTISQEIWLGPSLVNADKTHLFNVFYNIIENALKYSKEGCFVFVKANNKNNQIVVSFKDQGLGMTPETLKNIFKKYYRGSEVGEKKGFGLGLSYVKRILDSHCFDIKVNSLPNMGTTVIVTMNAI